jgi:hypothetical protein
MGATAADSAGAIRSIVAVTAMPDGVTKYPVRSMKVSDGFGGWRLSWVPPVKMALLEFSKSPVLVGEAFNVSATVPAGTPEGAYAVFRSSEGHNYRVDFPMGSTTVTLAGHSHGPVGTHQWWVDFVTAGGTTTFGPATQTAIARTTATVSTRAWVMSYLSSNPTGLNHIPNVTFSMSLSNLAAAKRVELQIAPWSTGVFKTIGIWTRPGADEFADIPGGSWTWDFANTVFDSTGMWSSRLMVTHDDGYVYESGHHSIDIRAKSLTAESSSYSPVVNTVVTLLAKCTSGCQYPQSASQWLHNGGAGWNPDSGSNPVNWQAWGTISWLWRETFEDGATIHSNVITVTPVAAPSPYHVRSWHTQADFQHIVNTRAGQQVLVEPHTYHFTSGKFYIPANTHIVATGSTFIVHQGIVNAGSGGGYGRAGGWTWEGGTFDGMGIRTTMFSLAHSPGFTIKGIRVRGCAPKGHGIEINSSGGPVQAGYTVVIDGCAFDGVMGHRSGEGSYDEAIHIDYAWGASAATANPENDGTVCNNVVVQNCHVEHTYPHNPTGYPVAFGSHKFSISTAAHPDSKKTSSGNWIARPPAGPNTDGEARPVEYHRHILCHYNTFRVSAYSGSTKRGAVHMRGWDNVVIGSNHALSSPSGVAAVTHDDEYTKNINSSPAAVNI